MPDKGRRSLMPKLPLLVTMLVRESFGRSRLERRPEPTALMEDSASVEAFHEQGSAEGPLLPVYHFNALATSRLVPEGGTVVDLGSGSGQYLAYLAERRPDLRIVGVDLSQAMVALGRRFLERKRLGARVDLRVGDMTDFADAVPERVDLVSSIFALHHLPTEHHVRACLAQVAGVRERRGCAVWIFDHARPRHPRTPEVFPRIFTPDAPAAFNADSRNSLIASFSFEELSVFVDASGIAPAEHHVARWMKLYQVHRAGRRDRKAADGHASWRPGRLPPTAEREFRGLRSLFPALELG
jgi:SAM-dependent methyltransferase